MDDVSIVDITEEDLDGYDPSHDSGALRREIWTDLSIVYRLQLPSLGRRLSFSWLRCQSPQYNIFSEQMHLQSSSPITATNPLGVPSVDVHV